MCLDLPSYTDAIKTCIIAIPVFRHVIRPEEEAEEATFDHSVDKCM